MVLRCVTTIQLTGISMFIIIIIIIICIIIMVRAITRHWGWANGAL
jgi:competence protein ComGC